MTTLIKERLQAVATIPLSAGGHTAPPTGEPPCGMCVMEAYAWVTGQDWTDDPVNCSRTIAAFLRRYNDGTDQDGRDRIGAWVFANVDRLAATAGDGRDEWRGYLIADFSVRQWLPLWLELAGSSEAAATLRALPEVTDTGSWWSARDAVDAAREGLPNWWEARQGLRKRVREAVEKALKEKGDAADAVAVAVADAAAVAAAVAAAAAVADAAAVAAAVADAAAVAAAAADAAAAAVAAADAAAGWSETYSKVYKAVRARYDELFSTVWAPAVVPIKESVIVLLDRLVEAPAGEGRVAA